MSFKRVAIVTGASRGIGKAIAIQLAKDGLDVVISDLEDSPYDAVLADLTNIGSQSRFKACDVREEEQVQALVNFTLETYGRLDVMVANAGICRLNYTIQTTKDQLQDMLQTNVHGTLYSIKYAGAAMVDAVTKGKAKGSTLRIIVAGSLAGKKGGFLHGAYVSTKFAIRGLVQTAAMELGHYGITVNSYAPGVIMTELVENAAKTFVQLTEGIPGFGSEGGPEAFANAGAQQSALKRVGEPQEVADLVSFLASEKSSFITGQSISIDGGSNFD